MSRNLHLTLHESDLWVELSKANLLEIIIGHCKGCISLLRFTLFAGSLAILKINLINQRWLGSLLLSDLESKDGVNLWNQVLS